MKWFKHDTDANMDAKLQEVMLDYGLEGYGLYWYCIELIAQNVNGDNLTFELEHDARIIARNTGSTPQKVEQMMTSFVNLGLLDADNGHIFCLRLATRCDDFTAKAVRRNGIKTLRKQQVGVSPTNSEKVPLEEEEEVRSKKKEKEVDVDKRSLVPATPKREKFSEGDLAFVDGMLNLLVQNNPKFREPNRKLWADDVRKMREIDNIDHNEMARVFTWASKDTFWSSNILSPSKLRKQWDTLQANSNKQTGAGGLTGRNASNVDMIGDDY